MNTAAEGAAARDRTPPWGIVALAALVLIVLIAVLAARLSGYQPEGPPLAAVVAERQLGFRDAEDGRVDIYDWRSGETIDSYASGEGSFLRGVLRSLVRQRRSTGASAKSPFLLTRHADGRLRLSDPSTGEAIDLAAFGPDNAAVFAAFLPERGARAGARS